MGFAVCRQQIKNTAKRHVYEQCGSRKTENLVQNSTPPLKRQISFRKRCRLPALAKVIKRFRQIYNLHALKLEEGETVKLTKIFENDQCEGILHGKKGLFPFVNIGR